MDRLTPFDIERMQFPKNLRGFDPKAVSAFLLRLSQEQEALLKELKDLQKDQDKSAKGLAAYRDQEGSIAETLKLAQKTADETRATAHKEAELIVAKAHMDAEKIRRDAELAVDRARFELEGVRAQRREFELRFQALLKAYSHDTEPHLEPVEVHNGVASL